MRLDKQEHKKIMLNILADISADSVLSVHLGFKGGDSMEVDANKGIIKIIKKS